MALVLYKEVLDKGVDIAPDAFVFFKSKTDTGAVSRAGVRTETITKVSTELCLTTKRLDGRGHQLIMVPVDKCWVEVTAKTAAEQGFNIYDPNPHVRDNPAFAD